MAEQNSSNTLEREALIREFAIGSEKAYAAVYKIYFPELVKFIRKTVPGLADAEDIAQETFMKAWEAVIHGKFEYRSRGEFWGFLCRIALNLSWNRNRKADSATVSLDSPTGDEESDALNLAQNIPDPDTDVENEYNLKEVLNFFYDELDALLLAFPERGGTANKLQKYAYKLYFEDHCSWESILLEIQRFDRQKTADDMRTWLAASGTIRKAAYRNLYFDLHTLMPALYAPAIENLQIDEREKAILRHYYVGGELIVQIAERESQTKEEIKKIVRKLCVSKEEEKVLNLYYLYGFQIERSSEKRKEEKKRGRGRYICEQDELKFSAAEICHILKKVDLNKMLYRRIQNFISRLATCELKIEKKISKTQLSGSGLWERLTFQYYYIDKRTQERTLMMLQSPAEYIGKALTKTAINNWTAGNRILRKFLDYLLENHPERIADLNNIFAEYYDPQAIDATITQSDDMQIEKEILRRYYLLSQETAQISKEIGKPESYIKAAIGKYHKKTIDILVEKISKKLR